MRYLNGATRTSLLLFIYSSTKWNDESTETKNSQLITIHLYAYSWCDLHSCVWMRSVRAVLDCRIDNDTTLFGLDWERAMPPECIEINWNYGERDKFVT